MRDYPHSCDGFTEEKYIEDSERDNKTDGEGLENHCIKLH